MGDGIMKIATDSGHGIETYKLTYELMKFFVKTPSMHPDVRKDAKFFVQLLDDCQVYELDSKILIPNIVLLLLLEVPSPKIRC